MTMFVNTGINLRSMFLVVVMFACLTIYIWRQPDTYKREIRFTNEIVHLKHWTRKSEDKMEVEIVEDMLPLTTLQQPKHKPTLQPNTKPKPPTIYLSLKPMHCVVHGMRQQCVGPFHKNLIGVNQCQTPLCVCFPQELVLIPPKPIEDPNFPPKNEMLPVEQKTLHDAEFVDILTAASLNYSTLTLLNPKTQYKVGDVITVRINMVDGYGKQRVVGGDDVRVRMIGIDSGHRASGNVMDFNNGSYTVTLKALWSGKVKIEAALPYTRESIASMLKWRRQYKTLFYYYGHFIKGTLSEYTMCSPYPTIQGYPSICNLTSMNYNYPWFCGQPINPLLSCDDFILANDFDYTQIPVTPAQFITFDRLTTKVKLKSVIELDISPGLDQQKQVTCNKLPRKQTWNITMPTGYFEKKEWKLLKCKNDLTKADIMSCLQNLTVIFYGDSTTRQWYKVLQNVTDCDQKTEKWTKPKWYEYSKCYHEKMNFTLIWAPHVFPFPNGRKEANGKSSIKPAVKTLEELPTNGKIVFVLHYFCHYARQHYTLFRDQIRSLKPALRKALSKNKDLHVAIKAPHVFYETMCPSHLNDFPGPIFTDILQEELKEFQDSVWYLNLWDMNLATDNGPIHPPNYVVWQYLKLLFGFTCK